MTTSKELTAKSLTIREIFEDGEGQYSVPDYQRNYSWAAPEIEQLLDDVITARRGGAGSTIDEHIPGYFLGNLVTTRRTSADATLPPVWEVVDGQQRLTTLFLVLNELGAKAELDTPLADRLNYQSRRRASSTLRFVAQTTGEDRPPTDSDGYDSAILEGRKAVTEFLKQEGLDATARGDLLGYILDHVRMIRTELPEGTDLNRYFEIMNTRGQQLSPVDIVKARLMSPLGTDLDRWAFDKIWSACADIDGYVQMTLTRGNTAAREALFGAHWSWLDRSLSFEDIAELLPDRERKTDRTAPSIEPMTLDEALTVYATRDSVAEVENESPERFRATIRFPAFLLHALSIFESEQRSSSGRNESLDDKLLIEQFDELFPDGAEPESRSRVKRFAVHLLRTRNLFDAFVIKRRYTAEHAEDGEWSLKRLVKGKTKSAVQYTTTFGRGQSGEVDEVYDGDTDTRNVLLLQSMLRVTYTSSSRMQWITDLLRELQTEHPDAVASGRAGKLLRDYARAKVREAYLDKQELPTGFDIERIVFTYLDYLLLQEHIPGFNEPLPGLHDGSGQDYRSTFTFMFRSSIEHFQPRNHDHEQSGADVKEENLNLLGNLALITVSGNSKYSNNSATVKAVKFPNIPLQSTKLRVMSTAASKSEWDDEAIEAHHGFVVRLLRADCAERTD